MANTVQIRNSSAAAAEPSSLEPGELAINTADAKLFWEDSAGSIQTTYLQPNLGDLADVSDTVPSPNTSVYVLANKPGVGWSSQGTIGSVSVGSQPIGGWPSGSVGESLAGKASTSHASTHATGGSDALTPSDIGAAPAASPAITGNATFNASSGVPVTITNTGSGNSFLVNDASGDTTPFVVDSSGNTGIGTNPGAFSTSFNQLVVGDGGTFKGATIYSTTQGTLAFGDTAVTTAAGFQGFVAYIHTTDYMIFGTAGAERVRITSAGDVGIARGIPASRLDVNGVITVSAGSAAAPALVSGTGTSDSGIFWPSADTVAVSTAGVERLRIDASGNIRLGGFASNSGVNVIAPNASGTDTAGSTLIIGGSQGTGTGAGGQVVFATAPAGAASGTAVNARLSRMQVKPTGSVRFVPLASDPSTGNEAGDVYYNSTTNKLRVYNGTSWIDLH